MNKNKKKCNQNKMAKHNKITAQEEKLYYGPSKLKN